MSEDFPIERDALSLHTIQHRSWVGSKESTKRLKRSEKNVVITAYPKYIIIMDEIKDQVKNIENKLIKEGRSIGLNINEDRTKYLIISPKFNFSGRYDI